MADSPKPGRAKPVPERFEVFETDATAHLTEEQKAWKPVKLRPAAERFAVLTPQPTLVLKLHLAGSLSDADQVALTANIYGLVQALSESERELGGGGLALTDRRAEAATVILTLRHLVAQGATERAAKLTALLTHTLAEAMFEPKADALKVLDAAMQSPADRLHLLLADLLAGSRIISRYEVLTAA